MVRNPTDVRVDADDAVRLELPAHPLEGFLARVRGLIVRRGPGVVVLPPDINADDSGRGRNMSVPRRCPSLLIDSLAQRVERNLCGVRQPLSLRGISGTGLGFLYDTA